MVIFNLIEAKLQIFVNTVVRFFKTPCFLHVFVPAKRRMVAMTHIPVYPPKSIQHSRILKTHLIIARQLFTKQSQLIRQRLYKLPDLSYICINYIFRPMDINKDQAKTLTIEDVIKEKLAVYMREKAVVQQLFNIQESEVLRPFTYLWNLGGKKVRIIAALLIQDLFDVKMDEIALRIGGMTQLFHCATLIIDDIQDGSIQRRGKPCSHIVYGIDTAINAANLIYFLPAQKLIGTLGNSFEEKWKLTEIYMNACVEGHIGQGLDLQSHKAEKKEDLPSYEQYIKMVGQKTGGLMKMMVGMLGIVMKLDEEAISLITECMNFIGISFQITDDILNIENCMGKGIIAEDLHQRKFTLIVDELRENQEFLDLYFLKVKSQEVIHKLISIINANSVLQKCRAKAESYSDKAFHCLNSLKCPGSKQAFRLFIKFVVQRKN